VLAQLEDAIYEAVEAAVAAANRSTKKAAGKSSAAPIQFVIESIGERPAATLPDEAHILTALKAVDRHLQIQSHTGVASTDANIPLSLGVEAISLGSGGSGGGIHSLQEWFDATGRDLALRRILLLLLALAQADL
jgi:hypothetical protein